MRSVFYGDKGTIIADNTTPFIMIYKKNITDRDNYFDRIDDCVIGMKYPVPLNSHNASAEIDEFINIIVEDKKVITDGIEGMYTVKACISAIESANMKEKVAIDYNAL